MVVERSQYKSLCVTKIIFPDVGLVSPKRETKRRQHVKISIRRELRIVREALIFLKM